MAHNTIPSQKYGLSFNSRSPPSVAQAPEYVPPNRVSCIVRTSTLDPAFIQANPNIVHDCVRLLIDQDLMALTHAWHHLEIDAERRLVKVHFKRISPCEYFCHFSRVSRHDFVASLPIVSCIYWRENDTYIVTSVDVILILENFVQQNFTIEEKNRIRRNLQSLKPYTISRANACYKRFFNLLMSMENPRPRNIEQDLKVFRWDSLFQALGKVVSKYSVVDCSPNADAVSPQVGNIGVLPFKSDSPSVKLLTPLNLAIPHDPLMPHNLVIPHNPLMPHHLQIPYKPVLSRYRDGPVCPVSADSGLPWLVKSQYPNAFYADQPNSVAANTNTADQPARAAAKLQSPPLAPALACQQQQYPLKLSLIMNLPKKLSRFRPHLHKLCDLHGEYVRGGILASAGLSGLLHASDPSASTGNSTRLPSIVENLNDTHRCESTTLPPLMHNTVLSRRKSMDALQPLEIGDFDKARNVYD